MIVRPHTSRIRPAAAPAALVSGLSLLVCIGVALTIASAASGRIADRPVSPLEPPAAPRPAVAVVSPAPVSVPRETASPPLAVRSPAYRPNGGASGRSIPAEAKPANEVAIPPANLPPKLTLPAVVATPPLPAEPPARSHVVEAPLPAVSARRLAEVRGRNWVIEPPEGSTCVFRALTIECYADRLVIVPEPGLRGGQTIPLGIQTEESIDAFLAAASDYVQQWGTAGAGKIWQPVVECLVAEGGLIRFAELRMLFDGSGLEIRRARAE